MANRLKMVTALKLRMHLWAMRDEIIEELWGIKDSIAREHGNDVRKLSAYLQSKKDTRHARMTNLGAMNELSETDKAIKPSSERSS